MSEWTKHTLGEICSIVTGKTPSTRVASHFGNDIMFVTPRDMNGQKYIQRTERYLSPNGFESVIRNSIPENSVCVSCIGSDMGKVIMTTEQCVTNQQINSLVVINGHPEFIYYNLSIRQEEIKNGASGSAVPIMNKSTFSLLPINLPPLPEQKAIAHILGKLDEKIELNRKMNQTLEAMAQALFKSWFVDFDPVIDNALAAGHPIPEALQAKAAQRQKLVSAQSSATGAAGEQGSPSATAPRLIDTNPALAALFPNAFTYNESLGKWIPEGWEVKKLCELVEIKYGKDHKKLEEGPIPCYGSGGIMRFVDKAIHEEASVLIPRKGTLNNIFYTSQPFWSVDTMFFTKMRCNHFIKYFFYSMKRLDFNEMNEGSAVPSMTTAQLNAMDILHPNPSILKHFDKILDDLFAGIEARSKETETLTQIRDTLLPQLISGKVRVPEGVVAQYAS